MDNTTTNVIATVVAISLGFLIYRMGCTSSVQPLKSDSNSGKQSGSSGAKSEGSNGKEKKKVEEKKYAGGKLSIFFGSQTGTAEGFARTLMEEGRDNGFDAKMADLDEFTPEVLKDTEKAIFLMATYGEGEPTDNAAKFIKWLKGEGEQGEVEEGYLKQVNYTVFGLGNKQYEHYNRMGKLTNSLLEKHGAKVMYAYGEGDDDGTLEEDFLNWKANLWKELQTKFIHDGSVKSATPGEVSLHAVQLEFDVEVYSSLPPAPPAASPQVARQHYASPLCPIVSCKELRAGATGGSTMHIDIDLGGEGRYEGGDNMGVMPMNPPQLVEKICKMFGYNMKDTIVFTPPEGKEGEKGWKAPFPSPLTIGEVLSTCVDLQGEVRGAMLKSLLFYVSNAAERERILALLSTSEGRGELKLKLKYVDFPSMVSAFLPSMQIPLSHLLHILPPLQPRYYTISSSPRLSPRAASLTVALTKGGEGEKWLGLCSGYLHRTAPPSNYTSAPSTPPPLASSSSPLVRVFIRPSTFRLPASAQTPVIMVGPGTGIAPFRAFMQEREGMRQAGVQNRGEFWLFFGCRNRETDWLYKQEMEAYLQSGVLTKLCVAFSRDASPAPGTPPPLSHPQFACAYKTYVMSLLEQEGEKVVQMMREGGHFYVCGATQMGQDVNNVLQALVKKYGAGGKGKGAGGEGEVKRWQEEGRYVQELWTA